MAPMPLRVTRMLDEVSIKDIELLYSASLEWHRHDAWNIAKGNRRGVSSSRLINEINPLRVPSRWSTDLLERKSRIRVEIRPHRITKSNGPHSKAYERKKGDRGSHIASPLEKSFRVTLTQETPRKYARAYFPIYFHIYKRVTSAQRLVRGHV